MFREWGFLLTEMVGLIVLAALLGLFAGWVIWGRRSGSSVSEAEVVNLRRDLKACHAAHSEKDARIAALQADLSTSETKAEQRGLNGSQDAESRRADTQALGAAEGAAQSTTSALSAAGAAAAVSATTADAAEDAGTGEAGDISTGAEGTAGADAASGADAATNADASAGADDASGADSTSDADTSTKAASADMSGSDVVDRDGDGVIEGTDEGEKPATLDAARDGTPDDLKQIKGIGPKLEALCNRLGFYHFDQIAAWTPQEVAWVDANLEGFKGRVTRDEWVAQAKLLASGGETEFSERVKDGDVY